MERHVVGGGELVCIEAIVRNGGMSNGPGIGTSDWAVDGLPGCDINH